MHFNLKLLLLSGILFLCFPTFAQRKDITLHQADPRFTISAQRHYGFGNEEYWFYIQNNTNEEYELVVDVTINSTCHAPRNFKLHVNKVVTLKPGGRFTPDSDYSHIFLGGDAQKGCRKKDGDSYTYLSSISYRYSSIKNVTQEKLKLEREKKLKEEEKLAAGKKKAEERAAAEKKAAADKLAAEKKKEEELQKQKAAAAAAEKAKSSATTTATNTSGSGSATSTESNSTSKLASTQTSNSTTATSTQSAQQKQEEYEESQRLAREAAAKQEAALKAAEEQEARERQQKYDAWKEKKNQDRQVQETASVAASATVLYYFAGIIYDGMDSYNPDYSYQAPAAADKYKPVLFAGVEVGYSGTYSPLLFRSEHSTMINGKTVDEKSVISKDVITVNLNVTGKIGLEAENYGAYAFLSPQAGFSPIFDAYTVSLLVGGFRAYGGLKWAKGYIGFRSGSRQVYTYSLDAEEYGNGEFNNNFNRLEYGLRFTTNPDSDYRRSHISIGLIGEKFNAEGIGMYLDPQSNTLQDGKTPLMTGYAFQWQKDHMFNLYLNVFPEYIYGGDINYNSGPAKIDRAYNTGTFVEVGFVRSIDMFGTR
ncbi:hypothetical protein ACSX1A_02950 [Pontibacter sp. MBLB2868]|uniref:hypothetical protein n=1 Tax=Pontibacter sp. MBLB2868 TaxID=3451555 RepID=UPI003F74CD5B